jgi:hypothetical protein
LKKGDLAVEVCYNATQFGSSSNAETLIFARRIDDSVISNNNNKTNNNKISKNKFLSNLIQEDIVLTNEWQDKNWGDGVWLAPSEIVNDGEDV